MKQIQWATSSALHQKQYSILYLQAGSKDEETYGESEAKVVNSFVRQDWFTVEKDLDILKAWSCSSSFQTWSRIMNSI